MKVNKDTLKIYRKTFIVAVLIKLINIASLFAPVGRSEPKSDSLSSAMVEIIWSPFYAWNYFNFFIAFLGIPVFLILGVMLVFNLKRKKLLRKRSIVISFIFWYLLLTTTVVFALAYPLTKGF